MRIIISTILIVIISLTGIVFAIEAVDGNVSTILDPSEGVEDLINENAETPDMSINDPDVLPDNMEENKVEEDLDIENEIIPEADTEEILDATILNTEEKLDMLPNLDKGFTSPVFKIIVLAVAIIVILLLLLALSKKKDTMYAGHREIKASKMPTEKAKKEDFSTIDPNITALEEEEIIIPAIETKEEMVSESITPIEKDLTLSLEDTEDAVDLGLADEIPEDIELVVEKDLNFDDIEDIDDIDDIDQLSKAIQEKEEELKKLEEEVLEEKIKEEKIVESKDVEKIDKEIEIKKEIEEKPVEKKPTKAATKKQTTKKKELKETKTKAKVEKKEEVKTTTKAKPTAKKEESTKKDDDTTGLAEDFLKNMEKSMKEDKKK